RPEICGGRPQRSALDCSDIRTPGTPIMPNRNTPRLCFIGFGEAGQAIASGLRDTGIEAIAAWDILFPAAEGAALKQAGEAMGARVASSAADAASGADIIVSAVTAASSLEAARS